MKRSARVSLAGPLLAIDTATSVATVALGSPDGRLLAEDAWVAGYRHGEELLPRIDGLLRSRDLRPPDLGAISVGTGPGAFTGLRVGLATAKGLAFALGRPIVGVPTRVALLEAARAAGAREPIVLLLPAGPADRVLVRSEAAGVAAGAVRLPPGVEAQLSPGTTVVAIDLAGRAAPEALALGEAARRGLAAALLRLAAERLAAGEADDLAGVVPEYVTLPRGVEREAGQVALGRA